MNKYMGKKKIQNQKAQKKTKQYFRPVTSNLLNEQDFKQFAQKMSGVLSALAN